MHCWAPNSWGLTLQTKQSFGFLLVPLRYTVKYYLLLPNSASLLVLSLISFSDFSTTRIHLSSMVMVIFHHNNVQIITKVLKHLTLVKHFDLLSEQYTEILPRLSLIMVKFQNGLISNMD